MMTSRLQGDGITHAMGRTTQAKQQLIGFQIFTALPRRSVTGGEAEIFCSV
jgi:hypothetical protein